MIRTPTILVRVLGKSSSPLKKFLQVTKHMELHSISYKENTHRKKVDYFSPGEFFKTKFSPMAIVFHPHGRFYQGYKWKFFHPRKISFILGVKLFSRCWENSCLALSARCYRLQADLPSAEPVQSIVDIYGLVMSAL